MVGGVLAGMRHAPVDIPGTWAALRLAYEELHAVACCLN